MAPPLAITATVGPPVAAAVKVLVMATPEEVTGENSYETFFSN
jgi:hypothetical protein